VLFPTWTFLFFLVVVVGARWLLSRRDELVRAWLLFASYVFYLSWGPLYGVLLAGVTVATWAVGRQVGDTCRAQPIRKRWLVAGVVVNLGLLAFFKYAQFAVDQVHLLIAPTGEPPPALGIVLPLGVSFFTFHAVSYLVDSYRGGEVERSLSTFALYFVFFPHLIAGPIVRARELVPQLHARPRFDPAQFADGIDLILRGLVKKMVIADRLAEHSDKVFADPHLYGTGTTWLAMLCYAGQIYGDFSGYTDIARGASKLMGYEIPENFRLPYLAGSITEFGRRWHMTLSRWLRDYLYIALGGNRHGEARRNLNLFLTMGLGGLWHGAGWTFVLWGVFHGLLLVLHKLWVTVTAPLMDRARTPASRPLRQNFAWRIFATVATFCLVALGWVLFRAPDLDTALVVYDRLLPGAKSLTPVTGLAVYWAVLLVLLASQLIGAWKDGKWLWRWLGEAPERAWVRGLVWLLAIAACFFFAGKPAEFIYFAF
jgi:alginate O-acetyltransferase complex protein AlgI